MEEKLVYISDMMIKYSDIRMIKRKWGCYIVMFVVWIFWYNDIKVI